jgi:hypothetical protein
MCRGLMWVLGWLVNAYSSNSNYQGVGEFGGTIKGDSSTNEPGGMMEVAMLGFDLDWV